MNDNTHQLIEQLAGNATAVAPVNLRMLCLRWAAGMIAYTILISLITGVHADMEQLLNHASYAMEVALLVAIIVSSAISACLLSFPDQYQYRTLAWLPLPLLIGFAALMLRGWMQEPIDLPYDERGLECLVCISVYALIPGAWLFWQMRKLATTHSALAGAAAVTVSFALGALALRLNEVDATTHHMLQWHYGPMLAVMLIGLGLGKWLLKW
jgi:hypothetical protein